MSPNHTNEPLSLFWFVLVVRLHTREPRRSEGPKVRNPRVGPPTGGRRGPLPASSAPPESVRRSPSVFGWISDAPILWLARLHARKQIQLRLDLRYPGQLNLQLLDELTDL